MKDNVNFEYMIKEAINDYSNKENIDYVLFMLPGEIYDRYDGDWDLYQIADNFKHKLIVVDNVEVHYFISYIIKEIRIEIIEKGIQPIKFYPYDNILITKDSDMNATIRLTTKFPRINE